LTQSGFYFSEEEKKHSPFVNQPKQVFNALAGAGPDLQMGL
jgi:hypothetical protein